MNLPNDWSSKALSALVDAKRPISYGVVQTGDPVANGVPCVRVVDLASGKPDRAAMITTSQKISASYSRTVLAAGDVIIALRGEIGRAALVPKALEGANLTRGVALLACAPKKMDPKFMFQSLACQHVRREIMHGVNGTGLQEIPITNLRQVRLPVPPLPEQRKIADILTTWDEALTRLDALIEAQERRKKGLMQQLLTGRRRLKGFSKTWKHKRLDAVFERVDRAIEGEPEHVLSITAGRGFVDQREKFSRVIAGRNIENYVLLKKGEFSYNKGNSDRYPQGCVYRLEEFEEGAVPNVWISFRLRSESDSPLFYKHFFLYGGLNHGLHRLINAGVRNDGLLNLTASNFFSVTVPTPEPAEQAKLGDLFEDLSISIKNLRAQRTTIDQQKRGLMQRLLTGKLRVNA